MSAPPYVERLPFKVKFEIPGGYPNTFWVQTLNPTPHSQPMVCDHQSFQCGE